MKYIVIYYFHIDYSLFVHKKEKKSQTIITKPPFQK